MSEALSAVAPSAVVPRVLVEIPCRFTRGYLEAAFFFGQDADGEPLDDQYDITHLAPQTWQAVQRDCAAFLAANGELIQACDEAHCPGSPDDTVEAHAGRDFFCTREGNGVGFWDGDWPNAAGEHLSAAAKAFSSPQLYVGDDGKIYQAGDETYRSASTPGAVPDLAKPASSAFPVPYVDEAGVDRYLPGPRH